MAEQRDDKWEETAARWLRWLQAEADRISARTNDPKVKERIARGLKSMRRRLLEAGPDIHRCEESVRKKASIWERLLEPPKPPTGIDRLPMPGRPLDEQWGDLCLWLTIKAHQVIGETWNIELRERISRERDSLMTESKRPLNSDDLRLRVGEFKETVKTWCDSRIQILVPKQK
jgi:hypothetical protein